MAEPIINRGTALVNGIPLIGGMSWYFERNLKASTVGARASKVGLDTSETAYTIRAFDKSVQYALISKESLPVRGASYSLAAHVAYGLQTRAATATWIAALALPNGQFSLVAVRDFAITPDGDFVGSRDEVVERFHTMVDQDWGQVFAPSDFAIAGAVEVSLDSAISRKSGGFVPQANFRIFLPGEKARKNSARIIIPILLCAVVGAGYLGYEYWQTERRAELAKKDAARRAAEVAAKKGRPIMALPTPPWFADPSPVTFVTDCLALQMRLPRSVAGWKIGDVVCEKQVITATYIRGANGSTVNQFQLEISPVAADLAFNDTATSVKVTGNMGKPVGLTDERLPSGAAGVAIQGRAQAKVMQVAVASEQTLPFPPSSMPPGVAGVPPVQLPAVSPWRSRGVTIASNQRNVSDLLFVVDVPGFRVGRLTITPSDKTKIEGTLYVN